MKIDVPFGTMNLGVPGLPDLRVYLRCYPIRPPVRLVLPATLRVAGDYMYVVSHFDATVAVVDPATWTVLRTLSVGAGREPVDIAVIAPELAYVSCADEIHLPRFNPITGQTTPVVDLSVFADADGIPDQSMMAVYEGRLFIQLRRIDSLTFGAGAVVGCAVECVLDEHCDDGNECTEDSCVATECDNPPAPAGDACDDGLFCTVDEQCEGNGNCTGVDSPCRRGEYCRE